MKVQIKLIFFSRTMILISRSKMTVLTGVDKRHTKVIYRNPFPTELLKTKKKIKRLFHQLWSIRNLSIPLKLEKELPSKTVKILSKINKIPKINLKRSSIKKIYSLLHRIAGQVSLKLKRLKNNMGVYQPRIVSKKLLKKIMCSTIITSSKRHFVPPLLIIGERNIVENDQSRRKVPKHKQSFTNLSG